MDDKNNYTPLTTPMAKETARKMRVIINDLHQGNHIDTMTKKWLLQTPNLPRIPVFYTLTKIHKPTLPGRPIILGCDGPTERILSFLDHILVSVQFSVSVYLFANIKYNTNYNNNKTFGSSPGSNLLI